VIRKIKKAAIEGNLLQKSIRFIFTKFPKILLEKTDWVIGCMFRAFYVFCTPINTKQIMFIPFQGDFTCNTKYIAEELLKRNTDYKLIFSARKASLKNREMYPKGITLVDQYSADFYREIIKSKMIIANSVEFLKKPAPKKAEQILIETWHGSLGIKRFGEKENHGKAWVSAAKRCGKRADFIISNSQFEDNVYRDTFWKTTPILQYGHPRNDILFSDDSALLKKIRNNILEYYEASAEQENSVDLYNHRFVLYAPTFRDNHSIKPYRIDFDKLREALAERFGGKWSVLVRLHPTVRKKAKKFTSKKDVIDVTKYPDIQELMLVSDVAITDYSSWIYDFVLTKRPGFIFATDIYDYEDERGFYYPLSSTPFPIATDNEELVNNVLSFDEAKYRADVNSFLEDKGCVDDGLASKRTVDKIVELMGDVK